MPKKILSVDNGFNHIALIHTGEIIVMSWLGDMLCVSIDDHYYYPEKLRFDDANQAKVAKVIEIFSNYNLLNDKSRHDLGLSFGLGSARVGDFIAQLNALSIYINSIAPELHSLDRFFISKSDCFWDPTTIFPQISNKVVWVDSIDDIRNVSATLGYTSLFL